MDRYLFLGKAFFTYYFYIKELDLIFSQEKWQLLPKTYSIEKLPIPGYAGVFRLEEKKSGLLAFLALHSLVLGPSIGGVRMFSYLSEKQALKDALRLSEAMTYKAAVSGLGIGGGKSVIMEKKGTSKDLVLQAFGSFVELFSGAYIAAQDVGTGEKELQEISKNTKYVVGLPQEGISGDPSKFTSRGVFRSIEFSVKEILSRPLAGASVAIQGLGNVGMHLCEQLFWEGANLIVSDLDQSKVRACQTLFSAKVVDTDKIITQPVDVFSPCALGGVLCADTIAQLRAKIVVGGANNVLANENDEELLERQNIIYIPDYVANAGGLLKVAADLEDKNSSPKKAQRQIDHIPKTLRELVSLAKERKISMATAARELAERRLKSHVR